ncbi:MAG: LamG domain-containing protein, partial [Sediminibacterium sp.]|nr:LamG domain-containing protein [Sediminibacterium sp.]
YYSAYTTYFGGLIGYSVNANITNCYTNVDVGAIGFVGGLIGQSESSLPNKTYIKNCYTAGKQKLLLNNYGNSVLIGVRTNQSQAKDSIINTYSVSRFVGRTTPFTNTAGLFIGCSNDNYTNSYDTIFVKGCFSIENKITPINFYTSNGSFLLQNKTAKMIDTVFTGSSTKNFSPITGAAYNGTYLYSATNQQYPVLYRSDIPNTLLGGQLAVYPAVVEKNTGSINGFADSVTPVDNFTKNGNTTFNIHNINGITDINNPIFSYFNIRPTNGMLSWIEEIPAGEYLVEVRGINGTENSQSWIRVTISRGIDALVSVNAQSVQFTTKDSTRNGDYIVIDSLNLINRNFTVETWAKMDNRAAAWKRIFDFGTGANTNGVLLGFPTPTQFGFLCNGIDRVVTFPAGYNPLAWNHYALTQQNDSVKLYVNGVYVGGGRGAKPTIGFNKNYIGRSNFTTDSCTAGRFSECRVWLKAHTATQIAKLYNKKVPANADSLYVYLPLTTNVYGEYPILNSLLYNYAENVYGNFPTTYFNRVSNT